MKQVLILALLTTLTTLSAQKPQLYGTFATGVSTFNNKTRDAIPSGLLGIGIIQQDNEHFAATFGLNFYTLGSSADSVNIGYQLGAEIGAVGMVRNWSASLAFSEAGNLGQFINSDSAPMRGGFVGSVGLGYTSGDVLFSLTYSASLFKVLPGKQSNTLRLGVMKKL